MRGTRLHKPAHSEHPFRKRAVVLKKRADGEIFMHFFGADVIAPLGIAGDAEDSRAIRKSVWDCKL
jgi:hypothetical protein